MHPSRAPLSPSLIAAPPTVGSVITRLRRAIGDAGLDCVCRDAADAALDRCDAEEDLRCRAAGLADARRMRDAIVLVLGLLSDLDELTPDEPDRSAFRSAADLFQDIADFAAFAAVAAGRAAGRGEPL
ncbi:hypothetical protein [Aquibium microcysteis]|uniref:hypothetical protein n=1 Tax=Aquibium microcysteis TaxID=675281 RepID=UPI001EF2A6E0|nr:hypothetical protein [Aquibium microcysteis]